MSLTTPKSGPQQGKTSTTTQSFKSPFEGFRLIKVSTSSSDGRVKKIKWEYETHRKELTKREVSKLKALNKKYKTPEAILDKVHKCANDNEKLACLIPLLHVYAPGANNLISCLRLFRRIHAENADLLKAKDGHDASLLQDIKKIFICDSSLSAFDANKKKAIYHWLAQQLGEKVEKFGNYSSSDHHLLLALLIEFTEDKGNRTRSRELVHSLFMFYAKTQKGRHRYYQELFMTCLLFKVNSENQDYADPYSIRILGLLMNLENNTYLSEQAMEVLESINSDRKKSLSDNAKGLIDGYVDSYKKQRKNLGPPRRSSKSKHDIVKATIAAQKRVEESQDTLALFMRPESKARLKRTYSSGRLESPRPGKDDDLSPTDQTRQRSNTLITRDSYYATFDPELKTPPVPFPPKQPILSNQPPKQPPPVPPKVPPKVPSTAKQKPKVPPKPLYLRAQSLRTVPKLPLYNLSSGPKKQNLVQKRTFPGALKVPPLKIPLDKAPPPSPKAISIIERTVTTSSTTVPTAPRKQKLSQSESERPPTPRPTTPRSIAAKKNPSFRSMRTPRKLSLPQTLSPRSRAATFATASKEKAKTPREDFEKLEKEVKGFYAGINKLKEEIEKSVGKNLEKN